MVYGENGEWGPRPTTKMVGVFFSKHDWVGESKLVIFLKNKLEYPLFFIWQTLCIPASVYYLPSDLNRASLLNFGENCT